MVRRGLKAKRGSSDPGLSVSGFRVSWFHGLRLEVFRGGFGFTVEAKKLETQ